MSVQTKSLSSKIRVCVIGAGAAGLCAARFLVSDLNTFEFVVFERNNEVGGTWIYTEKSGSDDYGLPIHTSMYKNLRSNVPRDIMNFPDFQRIDGYDGIHCCVDHEVILKYLNSYTDHFNIRKFIEFNTIVTSIYPEKMSNEKDTWNINVKNLQSNKISNLKFDAVMVCNGHFSVPYVPEISGIESFEGKILHSHSYRRPEDYRGYTVLILGASISGIDIASEIAEYAFHIYLSHNKERLTCELSPEITQVSGVRKVQGNRFFLNDGTDIIADTFIYCTGYIYSFPFLKDGCDIELNENYVAPLYKHLINIHHPSMCFIGLGNVVLPFLMFHAQVQYFLAFLKGVVKLPTAGEMFEDTKINCGRGKNYHKFGCKQFPYFDALAKEGKFEPIPRFYKNGFEKWEVLRYQYPVNSKYFKFILLEDGESVEILNSCGSEFVNLEMGINKFEC